MKQNFFNIDLVSVLNPLYALPIVAVVLCAFLVYAFGFKAPVQPPSFDDIEIEKKPTKKKKGKENPKNKQANGKVSVHKGNDALANKKKSEKAVKNEVKPPPPTPQPPAVKKTPVVEKKKKSSIPPETVVVDDGGNEEGWVHLVSKKARKNRKKDEITATIAEAIQPVESPLVRSIGKAKENPKEDENISAEAKVAANENSECEFSSVKNVFEEVKSAPKKQRPKKEPEEVAKPPPAQVENIAMEQTFEHTSQLNIESESSESHGNEIIKTKKVQKVPKKKKKKKDEASSELCDITNITTLPDGEQEPKSVSVMPEKTWLPSANSTDTVAPKKPAEPIEAKGSNVAFDELEGLYPDTKESRQKKKKKARRDH